MLTCLLICNNIVIGVTLKLMVVTYSTYAIFVAMISLTITCINHAMMAIQICLQIELIYIHLLNILQIQ